MMGIEYNSVMLLTLFEHFSHMLLYMLEWIQNSQKYFSLICPKYALKTSPLSSHNNILGFSATNKGGNAVPNSISDLEVSAFPEAISIAISAHSIIPFFNC